MALVKIGSTAEIPYKFKLSKERHAIIKGTHQRTGLNGRPLITGEPMITLLDEADWNEICETYGKFNQLIKSGIIFKRKNDNETMAMAADADLKEIPTGTKQVSKKDLAKGIEVNPKL